MYITYNGSQFHILLKKPESLQCNFFFQLNWWHVQFIKLKKFFRLLKFLAVERKLQYFTINLNIKPCGKSKLDCMYTTFLIASIITFILMMYKFNIVWYTIIFHSGPFCVCLVYRSRRPSSSPYWTASVISGYCPTGRLSPDLHHCTMSGMWWRL